MKHLAKFLLTSIIASYAVAAYASCTTSTITYDGKMMTCTTCCFNGNCNTTCF